jgi:phospho-N-acetylmuramoyl-pentapeptide-transferase
MVYSFLYPLSEHIASFRTFGSVSFRAACAALTAFLICLIVGPGIIERLAALRWREKTATESDQLNDLNKQAKKEGTPTMGGMIFVLATVCSALLWARLDNRLVVVCLWTMVAYGVLGGFDDRIKLLEIPDPKRPGKTLRGMAGRPKLIAQTLLGLFAVGWMWYEMRGVPGWTEFRLPFLPEDALAAAPLFILAGTIVLVGTNNAVNLTDGLDGLAAGCGTIVVICVGVMAFIAGRSTLAAEMGQVFVPGGDEVAVFLAALAGGTCGFLWWNCNPARVFMGNTGSLALGGALGIAAIAVRQEILLLIAGFAFVWEALSVILQVASFRWRGGKRIFLCAPFHHHLQFKGWPESRVVMSFWIGTVVLSVVALGLQRVI